MKFKYFLRGLGVGIIFASVISITAFQSSDMNKISDKEVIERAKELGMVEKQESVQDALKHESQNEDTQDKTTIEKATEQTSTEKEKIDKNHNESTEDKSKEKNTEKKTIEKETTQNKATEKSTTEATTQEATTKTPTTQESKNEKKTVQITIRGGMSSYPVCQMLQDLGMIKDAAEFDDYLVKNGYANRISVGTHTLTIGMSFEEIAIAISDPQS